jgi:hypothetical protein
MTIPTGTQLGAYEILAPLGAGAKSIARNTRFDRAVVLKVLPAELAADAQRVRGSFRQDHAMKR